jgi:crotonobetainyl-CoA:carnitine CoA-transferase CaiB-like acyl-CoA transferase
MKPLSGMRVLDLSKILAGPLCGQYLGHLGADVIKVEPVGSGDDTRGWAPQEKGVSALFLAVNHNKRSLALDLKSEEGRAIVHQLAARADIVLQGFGGGAAARLGVDYETLRRINPRLIYCEISGYGRNGPLGEQPGYDVMLQAFSGMMSTMGERGGTITRASFSPVDLSTGMNAVSGVLAAVIERGRTGEGVYLETSLLDNAMALVSYLAQNYWRSGENPRPMGTGHPSLAPYQAFEASDGSLMLGCGNDGQWSRLCALIQRPELRQDPDFATNAARVRNFDRTVAIVAEKIREEPVAYWLETLGAAKLPCAPIHSIAEALAHPQIAARGLLAESEHPVLGRIANVAYPIQFAGETRMAERSAPLLGEHSAEILRELGYDEARIARLTHEGLIQTVEETV